MRGTGRFWGRVLRPNSLARPERYGNHRAMHGRFAVSCPLRPSRLFGTTNPLPNLATSRNVGPANDVAVIRSKN
jgi:hypothetical protein